MQGERLPVPDSPHKMLIYSSGNCRLLICPTRKTLICQYSTMLYSSSLSYISAFFPFPCLFSVPYSLSASKTHSWWRLCSNEDATSNCLPLFFNDQNVKWSARVVYQDCSCQSLSLIFFQHAATDRFVTHQYFRFLLFFLFRKTGSGLLISLKFPEKINVSC